MGTSTVLSARLFPTPPPPHPPVGLRGNPVSQFCSPPQALRGCLTLPDKALASPVTGDLEVQESPAVTGPLSATGKSSRLSVTSVQLSALPWGQERKIRGTLDKRSMVSHSHCLGSKKRVLRYNTAFTQDAFCKRMSRKTESKTWRQIL